MNRQYYYLYKQAIVDPRKQGRPNYEVPSQFRYGNNPNKMPSLGSTLGNIAVSTFLPYLGGYLGGKIMQPIQNKINPKGRFGFLKGPAGSYLGSLLGSLATTAITKDYPSYNDIFWNDRQQGIMY